MGAVGERIVLHLYGLKHTHTHTHTRTPSPRTTYANNGTRRTRRGDSPHARRPRTLDATARRALHPHPHALPRYTFGRPRGSVRGGPVGQIGPNGGGPIGGCGFRGEGSVGEYHVDKGKEQADECEGQPRQGLKAGGEGFATTSRARDVCQDPSRACDEEGGLGDEDQHARASTKTRGGVEGVGTERIRVRIGSRKEGRRRGMGLRAEGEGEGCVEGCVEGWEE